MSSNNQDLANTTGEPFLLALLARCQVERVLDRKLPKEILVSPENLTWRHNVSLICRTVAEEGVPRRPVSRLVSRHQVIEFPDPMPGQKLVCLPVKAGTELGLYNVCPYVPVLVCNRNNRPLRIHTAL